MFIAFFHFDHQNCYINLARLDLPDTAVRLNLFNRSTNFFYELFDSESISKGDSQYVKTNANETYADYKFTRWNDMFRFGIGLRILVVLVLVVLMTLFAETMPSSTAYLSIIGKVTLSYRHAYLLNFICIFII